MNTGRLIGAAAAVVFLSAAAIVWAGEKPEIFADLSYEEAQSKAVEGERLLIIDFTAEWCGPCKVMDKTTWVDDSVIEWMDEHAIAIQVDVDHEQDVAKAFRIRAMPTVVAVKEGEEFDRVVGLREADELIEWLENVRAGRSEMDRIRQLAGDRANEEGQVNIGARLDLAGALLEREKYDEATKEFVWLWKNMLEFEPSMRGVRVSFMLSDIGELMEAYAPARDAFAKVRDDTETELREKKKGYDLLSDWISLNRTLGDEDRILEWFDRVKDRPGIERAFMYAGDDLMEILIERKRWADAGRIHPDPVGRFRMRLQLTGAMPEGLDEEMRERMEGMYRSMAIEQAAPLYASCLAAERDEEAEKIADLLLEKFDTAEARVALVEMALEAEQPREDHVKWLDEAAEMGEDEDIEPISPLRRQLIQALKESSDG